MKTPKYWLILLLLPLMAMQCDKNPPEEKKTEPEPTKKLPPITTEGKNTFGCYVNGELWLPERGGGATNPLRADWWKGQFFVSASRADGGGDNGTNFIDNISISGSNLFSERNYTLNDTDYSGSYRDYLKDCRYKYWEEEVVLSMDVNIIFLDTVNYVASGTFSYLIYMDEACDTIRIDSGRFDVKI